MSVDTKTVARIAELARIKVAEDERETLAAELGNIIGWVEQLAEVDTDGVAPMASGVRNMGLRRRDDAVTDGDCAEDVLANAPDRAGDYFAVPKVVE